MLLNCVISVLCMCVLKFFLLLFPLISSFLCEASRRDVLYVQTGRQYRLDDPASGPKARNSASHLCGTLRQNGFSDLS
jgi:hypothetical protein